MRNLGFIPFSVSHSEINICNATSKSVFKMSHERYKFLKTFQKLRDLGAPNSFWCYAKHNVFMKHKISYINLL